VEVIAMRRLGVIVALGALRTTVPGVQVGGTTPAVSRPCGT